MIVRKRKKWQFKDPWLERGEGGGRDNTHGKMDTTDSYLHRTQDTRSFRVVAGNKLHVPGRLGSGPLFWFVLAWSGRTDFGGSRY